MMARTQIVLDPDIHRQAKDRAAHMGVSFAEYVRRLVAQDLGEVEQTADVSIVFDLGGSGGSDISKDKDRLIAEAFAAGRRQHG